MYEPLVTSVALFSILFAVPHVHSRPLHGPVGAELSTIEQVIGEERSAWAAAKRGDKTSWTRQLANDYRQIDSEGKLLTRAQTLELFDRDQIVDYELSDMIGAHIDRDIVLLTYRFHVIGKYDGQNYEARSIASSMWVRRGDKYLSVFWQETPSK